MKKVTIPILLGTLIFFLGCSEDGSEKPGEVLIAKVGNKTISRFEFIRRAEYTIRPAYCRSDNYIHRKIVLNSLLAEKLFALEAGEQNELMQKMFNKVRVAAEEVGKNNSYTYIFDSSNGSLLYAGGEDVTPLIKTQLGL